MNVASEYNWRSVASSNYFKSIDNTKEYVVDEIIQKNGQNFKIMGLKTQEGYGSVDEPIYLNITNSFTAAESSNLVNIIAQVGSGQEFIKLGDEFEIITEVENNFIDLNEDVAKIKSQLRKSYKSLVVKQGSIKTVSADEVDEIIKLCKKLHYDLAGRQTRSSESWNAMASAVKENCGKLIVKMGGEGFLGYCYFFNNATNAIYGSSAMQDRKGAHGLIWRAILDYKDQGLQKLLMYQNRKMTINDEKLQSIRKFKDGFGGKLVCEKVIRFQAQIPSSQKEF